MNNKKMKNKNDFIYIVNSGYLHTDDKILKTLDEVYKFKEYHTNQIFKVNKKEFMKLYKQAREAWLERPVQWTFNRLPREGVNRV